VLLLRVVWPAQVVPMPRTARHSLVVGGRTRSYLLHHPSGWDAEQPRPLVLVFHGHTGDARDVRYESRMDGAGDRAGVLVAYPNGTGPLDRLPFVGGRIDLTWNAGACCAPATTEHVDDEAFVAAIVHRLEAEGAVDPRRVYAAGFSIGGTFALRLACDRPDLVAAVADVEGTMPDTTCAPSRGVSVLLVRGSDDDELRADLAENRARPGHRFADTMRGALRFWGARDGCARDSVLPVVRRGRADGAAWSWTAFAPPACAPGLAVSLLVVPGNPHAWPGGRRPALFAPRAAPGVPLSDSIVAFFLAHPRS
jgi:polyhydroxybutyrate depolymerase